MVLIRSFQPGDATPFRRLNEEWIRKWFSLKEPDIRMLEDPESSILSPGGQIYMAVDHGAPVGCCALIPAPSQRPLALRSCKCADEVGFVSPPKKQVETEI